LAAASHRGVDLTQGLLDLAKDLRRTLREDVSYKRKTQSSYVVANDWFVSSNHVAFVAAPIPSIVLGGR
jgi:hypothetical protein